MKKPKSKKPTYLDSAAFNKAMGFVGHPRSDKCSCWHCEHPTEETKDILARLDAIKPVKP